MHIYVCHARGYNFQKCLYSPIKKTIAYQFHNIYLPHDKSAAHFDSKKLFNYKCDLVIAEISHPKIGLGIELGWANSLEIPIEAIIEADKVISESVQLIAQHITSYHSNNLNNVFDTIIKQYEAD